MEKIHLEFDVDGCNFVSAGTATAKVKACLKEMGINPDDVKRVAIAMYEGEINMVIHANGGKALVDIYVDKVVVKLIDTGKGIADINLAMKPGYSTASDDIRQLGFGAGMGLPNMKKHSDECIVESEVGKGTTVTLITNLH